MPDIAGMMNWMIWYVSCQLYTFILVYVVYCYWGGGEGNRTESIKCVTPPSHSDFPLYME